MDRFTMRLPVHAGRPNCGVGTSHDEAIGLESLSRLPHSIMGPFLSSKAFRGDSLVDAVTIEWISLSHEAQRRPDSKLFANVAEVCGLVHCSHAAQTKSK